MILNNSTDPVLIKKISLKIWSLRDEVETVLKQKLEKSDDIKKSCIQNLRDEYVPNGSDLVDTNNADILPLSNLDDVGEDEMAKAIAEAEAGESSEDFPPTENSEEQGEDEKEDKNEEETLNLEALPTKDEKLISIIQRRPPINPEKLTSGRSILAEIGMNNMYLFTSKPYLQGQSIVIDFLIPNKFIINADVVFCRPYNPKSRVISENRHPYRMGIKFTFLKEGERTLLRKFISSIEPDVPEAPVAVKKPAQQDDVDDFDELDDLDL